MTYQPTKLARKALAFPSIFLLSFTAPILAQSPPELSFAGAELTYFWKQVGADIDGEDAYDRSGSRVSLSADGLSVAIGGTRIYRYDEVSNQWEQFGSDIDGSSLSLSADGLSVAIGGTRIYRYDEVSSQWEQLGSFIDVEAAHDRSGIISVSLSADGLSVAIGAARNSGNGDYSGHARIYRYNAMNSQWEQVGADIDGEAVGDESGISVSLSADGLNVAIGAARNDGNGIWSGHARIYRYNAVNSQWEQVGADLDGENSYDESGVSVSLSADGLSVAIGAAGNDGNGRDSGHARIYRYNAVNSQWEQVGADIDGEAVGDESGRSVSLSADGLSIAIGASGNEGNGSGNGPFRSNFGHTRIYRLNSPLSYTILENTTTITDVMSIDNADLEGAGLVYSLSGADAALFTISNSGGLEFVNAPDYGVPTDVGGDNVYDLVVTVTDSDGLSDSQVLAISVEAVPLVIRESDFDLSGQQVTLSWSSLSGKSYRVQYSPNLEDWDTVIGAGLDVEQDENPANPNELTMTFDLSGLIPAGAAKGFFRIEEEP